ncbi:MAG: amino acid adenylation domain-containing protein, partial [Candidatus Aminicenantes bacterium]
MNLTNQEHVYELFAAQVKKKPGEIAIQDGNRQITYRDLFNKANGIANMLVTHHILPGDITAVDTRSPLEMAAGLLGIIKAGGVYMPVDLTQPGEYIYYQLEHSQAKYLLIPGGKKNHLSFKGKTLFLDGTYRQDSETDIPSPSTIRDMEYPLAVIYASHSCGRPRGMTLSHRKILKWLGFNVRRLKVDISSTLFICSSRMKVSFPIWLVNLAIEGGGRIYFYEPRIEPNCRELIRLMRNNIFKSVACSLHYLQHLIERDKYKEIFPETVNSIITLGEENFNPGGFKPVIKDRKIRWHNYFGFPGIQMVTTLAKSIAGDFRHVGKPAAETSAYILNSLKREVAIGLPGELYVSGTGVMDKYNGNKDLNSIHFIENPLKPGTEIYKTGYRASWLPDGKISLLGRTDGLVDVNGYTIALNEVEAAAFKHPLVFDTAVAQQKDSRNRSSLRVYLVFKEKDGSIEQIEEYLKKYLPVEVFPIGFAVLPSLPRDAAGAVDWEYLEQCEFPDTLQLKSMEKEVKKEQAVQQAAVRARVMIEKPPPLHLKDYTAGINRIPGEVKPSTGSQSQEAGAEGKPPAIAEGGQLARQDGNPETIAAALKQAASQNSDKGIIYIQPDGSDYFQSYSALQEEAEKVLAGLRKLGLKPGDKVIFQFDRNEDFVSVFWGAILGGFVPVPMTVPKSLAKPNNETATLDGVWQALDKPLVLTNKNLERPIGIFFKDFWLETIENIRENSPDKNWYKSHPEDLALLLFTSGSTGKPKGVMQTHRSILAREKATIVFNELTRKDISLNWMPLEHVGGVLMFHVRDVYLGCTQVHARTEYILEEPFRWLELITRHRATSTWAPNFAYGLLNSKLGKEVDVDWDLSSMRFILNGGEAINAKSSKRFLTLLAPYGLSPTAMKPAWGMSETCSGVVYSHSLTPEPETGVHNLDKHSLTGTIRKSSEESTNVNFVELGKPIPGFSIRITGPGHQLLEEGVVGRIQVKGLPVTKGYYNNLELNREAFTPDGWLDTGDLGFILEGKMTITGRAKDIIIVNGINLNSVEIEAAVEEVKGVETSFTAACAVRDDDSDTERIVIFYSTRFSAFHRQLEQIKEIQSMFVQRFGMKADYVIPIAREKVPKTSIGKIQRTKLRKTFEEGYFDEVFKKIDIGLENENTLPSWFFTKSWFKRQLSHQQYPDSGGNCLVFEDEAGLAEQLVAKLQTLDYRCIRVRRGNAFKRTGPTGYEINHREAGDYFRLLEELSGENIQIDDIFHLYNFSEVSEKPLELDAAHVKDAQYRGVYSLLNVIRALEGKFHHTVRLFVVTGHTQSTGESHDVAHEKCTITAFLKSAALELSWLQGRHIDLEAGSIPTAVRDLIREWANPREDKDVVYRGGERLVPLLVPADMKAGTHRKDTSPGAQRPWEVPLKNRSVYLVTGGLGGIGNHVCKWLIGNWQARLVIVGRTSLPPIDEWNEVLQENTLQSRRLRAYRELESVSNDFIYTAGDVADYAFLKETAARAESRWGESLSGVFHLAGYLPGETRPASRWTVMDKHWAAAETRQTFENMFQSKVYGTIALHRLFKDDPRAIFVAFSSTIAFFGAGRFSAYAAANGFLDGFCLLRHAKGYPRTYCLNWSSWNEVGMSENTPTHIAKAMETSGYEMIALKKGLHSLLIALGSPYNQLFIGLDSTRDNIRHHLQEYPPEKQIINVYYTIKPGEGFSEPALRDRISHRVAPLHKGKKWILQWRQLDEMPLCQGKIDYKRLAEPDNDSRYPMLESDLPQSRREKILAEIWKEVLGKDRVGLNDNFFEIGGQSLKATLLASKIHEAFDVRVALKDIFTHPTIRELSVCLEEVKRDKYVAIAPVEMKEYYQVSSSQKRLYVLQQLDKDNIGYNMPAILQLEGKLNPERLEQTFNQLIRRHESLRTSFELIDGQPCQRIQRRVEFAPRYDEIKEPCITEIARDFIQFFDLSRAPLLRVGLIKLEEEKHLLLLDQHHIISDGISQGIFIRDFLAFYSGAEFSALEIQYKDFSQWQKKLWLSSGILKKQEAYWVEQLGGEIPELELPYDYPRPGVFVFEGKTLGFELHRAGTTALKEVALEEDVTLFMLLIAISNVLFSRLSGQEDIILGTPIAGRRHAGLQHTIGIFLNTLALRNEPCRDKPFREFLKEVKANTLKAYENQDYPFEELVEKVVKHRNTSRNPLFDVIIVLQNMENPEVEIPGLMIKNYPFDPGISRWDFSLTATEKEGQLHFSGEYNTRLFKPGTIHRFIGYLKELAGNIPFHIDKALGEIDIIPEEERRLLLYDFNDTSAGYPRDKVLHHLFVEQAEKTPDNTAVISMEQRARGRKQQLAYRELNETSNRLARLLRNKNVTTGTIVPLLLEPSIDMVAGILAVLKTGGVYLSIDPKAPVNRVKSILEDSAASLFLTTSDVVDGVSFKSLQTGAWGRGAGGREIVRLDELHALLKEVPGEDIEPMDRHRYPHPGESAYIIFTSGSTGKPKGVMVEHGNVVRLMINDKNRFDFNAHDVWTLFHSYSFDFSVWEMYGALLYGGTLVVVPPPVTRDPGQFLKLLKEEKVTVLNQTPSAFYSLAHEGLESPENDLKHLRYVIFGGEALSPGKLNQWKKRYPWVSLINMYGITETTVHVTYKEIEAADIRLNISNIGTPIPTLTVYIVTPNFGLAPIGAAGQMCIGGDGVSRGYLNRPELTAEMFPTVNNRSYKSYMSYFSKKLYKSGDLARWLAKGEIEYLGRSDQQVKIRGYRIEPGEIESHLLACGEIKEAVVVARKRKDGDKYLCAYIAAVSHQAHESAPLLEVSEIKRHLSAHLPDYMIPTYFVPVKRIPLTANGKVDLKALPGTERSVSGDAFMAPSNEIEKKMLTIWSEVLEISPEKIGVNADFFSLGGHSLKATSLASRVHKELHVKLPLLEIFKAPTINQLAKCIKEAREERYAAIEKTEKKEYYSLSSAQNRLYILQRMTPETTAYNMPVAGILEGKPVGKQVEEAFKTLIQRHESLRTSFHMLNDGPVQRIHDQVELKIEYIDVTIDQVEVKISSFIRPFDLSQAPLLRVGLIHTPPFGHPSQAQEGNPGDKHILMVDMHHTISDGTSMELFIKEMMALCVGEPLPALRLQYRDFVEWQNSEERGKQINQQQEYWIKEFSGEIPVLDLPLDYVRPQFQSFAGEMADFEISAQQTKLLKDLGSEEGATLYMVLLAITNVFLSKLSNQQDIVIGTPTAARRHVDLERILGMFVNTLAMRNYPIGNKTFRDFLKEVKEKTLKAFENQEYQFEDLVDRVAVNRDLSRNPLFDFMLLLQDMETPSKEIPKVETSEFKIKPYEINYKIAKFDLDLTVMEASGHLVFVFNYCIKLFKEVTIKRVINYFKQIIGTILNDPGKKLSEIEILTVEEKRQLLSNFNDTGYDLENFRDKTIHRLFEEQVEKVPDRTAVIGTTRGAAGRHTLTYRELNKKSDQLAALFGQKGIKPGTIVAIMVKRSLEMIIGLLGILKAGAAYLPIDPRYPEDRIDIILKDSSAKVLVSEGSELSKVSKVIEMIKPGELGEELPTHPTHLTHPTQLCYVIYTSGTTGMPKGVTIEHRNVINFIIGMTSIIEFNERKSLLAVTTISFDIFVLETLLPLAIGMETVIADENQQDDIELLKEVILDLRIDTLQVTPSRLSLLIIGSSPGCLRGIKTLIVGGEAFPPNILEYLRKEFTGKIYNVYGPTETTVWSTLKDLIRGGKLTIGCPIANTRVYILNPYDQLQPPGIAGELCIGGDGLSRGYLNRPELTAEKFIKNPIFDDRFYRTGDLARWLPDGDCEFLGRIDHQIKIRGYRIELGEIESLLANNQQIKEAVVVVKEANDGNTDGDKYLCAYFVADNKIHHEELRQFLSKELPDYMIPSYFSQIEEMPLTPNGKINRKALPGIEISMEKYVAPRNEKERALIVIWSEILGIDSQQIGIDDDFFRLGGHSLKATRLVYQIHKEFQVKIGLKEIFSNSTIRKLHGKIISAETLEYSEIASLEERDYYDLSYAQRRLWVLCQFEEDATAYNMPTALKISGPLNIGAFKQAVQSLVDRHESLRTVFINVNGDPKQEILKELSYDLEYIDLQDLEANSKQEKARKIYRDRANQIFDLEKGPLFFLNLVRLEKDTHLCIVNVHHIINDGWSYGIIQNELFTLYNFFARRGGHPRPIIASEMVKTIGKKMFAKKTNNHLPPVKLQYKDYTRWHNALIEGEAFKESEKYWLGKFKDKPNGIELPLDYLRRPVQTFNGGRVSFTINDEMTRQLWDLSLDHDATFFMSLLSLLNIFLYKYTGQQDIIVGSPIAGRKHPELQSMIGFLVNTLVYRDDVNPDETFEQLIGRIKQETIESYENQNYPFDLLIDRLELDRDLSQSPLFNVMLAHNNADVGDNKLALEGLSIANYSHRDDFNMSKFDLTFFIDEFDGRTFVQIEYNSDLFRHSTIERMSRNFKYLVKEVIESRDVPVSHLNILDQSEKMKVIEQFNETSHRFPGLSLQELFENQVEKSRDKIAVVYDEDIMTYESLNRKANRLANFLKEEYGVKANDIIGISVERSIDMIAIILGIIKSGAAYLAVDPTYPRDRVLHVLEDSRAKSIIIDKMRPQLLVNYRGEIINIHSQKDKMSLYSRENPEPVNRPTDILYVNYTSGSTGTPNGAMLSHGLLTNLVQWQKEKTSIDASLRCLQFTSINFCVSFQEIIITLVSGGELYLIGDIERQDIEYLMDFLSKYKIEILYLPFSYLNFLFNRSTRWTESYNHNLKHIITAGEQLKITVGLKKFLDLNPGLKLHNHYGSTEMHVVTSYTLDSSTAAKTPVPPVGKPIFNTKIHILDEFYNPVPIGVWGELFVAGSSDILGYIHNPQLNDKKLLKLPGLSIDNKPLYRSGDIGRWLPDGNIEVRGRKDFQVKIRGFRVEPGEIESKILAIEGIRECVVVVKENKSHQKFLAAYVVAKGIDSAEIKKIIGNDLPKYMMPQLIVLESLPLMPNGKVDRDRLPEPELKGEDTYIAPGCWQEEALVKIWSEVLEIDSNIISIHSDFFELGGHSLKATILSAKIHKEFGVKVPLTEIFRTPKIKELARYIKKKEVPRQYISIEPVEEREYYFLSSAQKRLYVLQQMDPGSTVYNIPAVMTLIGELDRVKFEGALKKFIQRHESLRTSIHMLNEEPVQKIHGKVNFVVEYYDSQVDSRVPMATLDEIIKNFVRPFNLEMAPLLRVGLIKQDTQKHILMIDMNHIISDGTSIGILENEFMTLIAGKEPEPLRTRYRDWTQWQNHESNSTRVKNQEAYWIKEFEDKILALNLPYDYTRPAVQDFTGKRVTFALSTRETDSLNTLARQEEVTLYMLLLSAYYVLLYKLTYREDIVIGAPTAGRLQVELQKIIGMFLNTLALRNFPGGGKPFKILLKEVKTKVLNAFENQEYQFDDLVDRLGVKREGGRNPIFDVMFILQNQGRTEIQIPGLELKTVELEQTTTKFDFSLYAGEVGHELLFSVTFCEKLFTPATITIIIDYFKAILASILKNPGQVLADINVISGERRTAILSQLNQDLENETRAIMGDGIFQTRLHRSLFRFKDNIAGEYGGSSMSYAELDRRSGVIQRWILNRGIPGNTFIGMLINHRLQLIVTLLGIIKAGSVIIPLYPGYPAERLEDMIQVTGLRYIFIDKENARRFKRGPGHLDQGVEFIDPARLDFDSEEKKGSEDHKAAVIYNPEDPLYIHFTSGSTGKPKAILGKNRGLLHFISWEIKTLGINPDFHAAQFTIPGFDPFLRDVFAPLLAGGVVCIPANEDIVHDSLRLVDYIEQRRISLIHCVTGLFRLLLSSAPPPTYFSNLEYILLAGEKTNPFDLVDWYEIFGERVQLFNCYGPTETTMSKVYYLIKPRDINRQRIPIGKPLEGSRVIILDENRNLCAPLEPGEICIRTPFGSCGYYNASELNREKFIPNPFGNDPDDIIYRSGDLGRVLADGNIDILGRTDRQVKIRGYRVEPGDIEHHLIKHPEIKDAVVVVSGDESRDNYLCAYIIPRRPFTITELREYLAQKLPDYMIPAYYVQMERFPLTARGKIDRNGLPEPEIEVDENFVTPANETEKKLLKIWSEVLHKDENKISVRANFFELGGHSLKAAALASKIHKELNANIPLADFFKIMTIRGLSRYIRGIEKKQHLDIEPTETRRYYPLSSTQKRLYFLQMMEGSSSAYNIPRVMKLEGRIKVEKLANVFGRLIQRHESLRTSFLMAEEEPVQRVHDHVAFEIDKSFAGLFQKRLPKGPPEAFIKEFIRPFDLSRAPLLRVGLVKLEKDRHILLVDMHHIISDAMSIQVLVQDFSALYWGKELPEIKLQYKDYAEWQNRERVSKKIQQQGEYWKKEYEGEIPVLELPTDYTRPEVQSFEGNRINFELNKETSGALQALALEVGATLYVVLLALYTILQAKLSSQEDIIIGSPVAGRRHADLENIIGMFVNTLALRNYPSGEKTFAYFLQEVKEKALKALENQEYQYEDLVEEVAVTRDVSRNPLFDTMFNLQNTGPQEIEIPGLKLIPYEFENKTSKFDLSLTGMEVEEKLWFTLEYSTKLFKRETIERFIIYFKNIVRSIIENKNQRISDLEILTEEEKNRILFEFSDTEREYPKDKTLHGLLEEQADRTPEHIALLGAILNDRSISGYHHTDVTQLTYRQLNDGANRLACLLIGKGIRAGSIVGIMVERSVEMIVGIMGILKSGGAYLPIDPEHPEDRIDYMLKDSAANVLITTRVLAKESKKKMEIVYLDSHEVFNFHPSTLPPFRPSKPSNLAYVIYTSGSTGKPKGVVINHRSVINFIKGVTDIIPFTSDDRILSLTTISFDIFGLEMLIPLASGSLVVMGGREEQLNPEAAGIVIEQESISIFQVTPSRLQMIITLPAAAVKLKILRFLLVGGETFPGPLLEKVRALVPGKIFNMYGPTETTIWSAVKDMSAEVAETLTIGKPIANTAIYILDGSYHPVPINVSGELYIGGNGLARGYLNRPELTAERFDHDLWDLWDYHDNNQKLLRGVQGG